VLNLLVPTAPVNNILMQKTRFFPVAHVTKEFVCMMVNRVPCLPV